MEKIPSCPRCGYEFCSTTYLSVNAENDLIFIYCPECHVRTVEYAPKYIALVLDDWEHNRVIEMTEEEINEAQKRFRI